MAISACSRHSDTVTAVILHPNKPEIFYVLTNDGIYKTRDGGKSWKAVTEGLGGTRVLTMAVHPVYTSMLFAGTLGDSVYQSMTGGQNWSIINAGMKEHIAVVNAFVFDPRYRDTLYAATTVGIFRSMNNGQLWKAVPNFGLNSIYVVSLALDRTNPDILYAGTSGGIYRSMNGGQDWELASRGMVEDKIKTALSLGINGILQDPKDTNILYVATTRGLFKSKDRAASWSRVSLALPGNDGSKGTAPVDPGVDLFVSSIVMDPEDPRILYLGTVQGVFKSTDGGTHWQPMKQGLTNTNIRSLVVSPMHPKTLYAGTHGGLFRSIDGGANWSSLPLRSQ